jgi:general secretion pathway protein I
MSIGSPAGYLLFIDRNAQSGFSLLEVLVAFTVLALSLGVMMQTLSSNSRGLAIASDYSTAAILAESILAQAGEVYPLEVSVQQGELEEGYRWRLEIVANPQEDGYLAQKSFILTSTVSWGEVGSEKHYELSTLRND